MGLNVAQAVPGAWNGENEKADQARRAPHGAEELDLGARGAVAQ